MRRSGLRNDDEMSAWFLRNVAYTHPARLATAENSRSPGHATPNSSSWTRVPSPGGSTISEKRADRDEKSKIKYCQACGRTARGWTRATSPWFAVRPTPHLTAGHLLPQGSMRCPAMARVGRNRDPRSLERRSALGGAADQASDRSRRTPAPRRNRQTPYARVVALRPPRPRRRFPQRVVDLVRRAHPEDLAD